MNDLEISKALALAIGWPEVFERPGHGCTVITHYPDRVKVGRIWHTGRPFDYRDWNVIGPIAAKYHAFPYIDPRTEKWEGYAAGFGINKAQLVWADTPQKAIALAVIQGAKK